MYIICICNVKTHKLLQVCKQLQVVTNLFTSCWQLMFALLVPSCCNKFGAVNNSSQAWLHYQTCYKVVLTSLIQSWYNTNVTRLPTQSASCNNIVISWLYRTCCLGQVVPTQVVDGLLADLLQNVSHKLARHANLVPRAIKLLQVCKEVVTNLFTSCRQVVFALLVLSCCNKFETSC
jgi:hypothetical protein